MVHLAEQAARGFEFSTDKIYLNVWISVGAAAGSCALCLFVLAAAGWIYSKPWARHTIDRVSFRLFLWSMLFEVFYDFAFIAVGVESAVPGASQSACATGVYFMMSTLGVVNYLCTCIALNLMLFVCFNINPLEQKLERWYLGVSLVLGMGVPIVPAILGHFGADPILNVCWIQAKDDTTRMKYFILDLYLWQSLSCVVATLAVIATLISLVRQRRRAALNNVDPTKPRLSIDTEAAKSTHEWQAQLQTKFTTIACLISLYPITLIIVNGFVTVGDLYMSAAGGVKSQSVYALYCIYYFLYGGRGIFFALLGIFVDPCLRRGLKTVWRGNKDGVCLAARDQTKPPRDASLLEILGPAPELTYDTHGESSLFSDDKTLAAKDSIRRGSKSSIEMSAALSRLPLEVPMSTSPSMTLGPAPASATMGREAFTRSFSGVPKGKLPEGLSDDVDITRQRVHDPYLSWTRGDQAMDDQVLLELEPLDPDLPDAVEERQRRRKAALLDREEALRAFEETQAQL